jgi:hypothetical protein
MNRRLVAALAASLCIGHGTLWAAGPRRVALKWSELAPRITDRKIALVLPDGTHVEGKVRNVVTSGLELRVSKTSDRKVIRKGEQLIPRGSVSVLRVTEYRKLGRILLATGALAATAGIVAAKYPDVYEGPALIAVPAVVAGGMVGVAAGSYYAGKRIDKRVTEIRIARD